MKDKITIGKDFNTEYTFSNGTRLITLENMPQDLTDINQILYLFNDTQGITYYVPADAYAGLVSLTGPNSILIDAGYDVLATNDNLIIIIGVKALAYDEDLNAMLTIPQARVPKEKIQYVDRVSAVDICTTDNVEVLQFELDVREYSEVTFLCNFTKNDSEEGKIIIYGLDEYGGSTPDLYVPLGATSNEYFLPATSQDFYFTVNSDGLNYLGFYTVAATAVGASGGNEDTITVSAALKPI